MCFNETKLDEYEVQIANVINLPPLNRKGAKGRSGRIFVFAKNYIFENVEVLKSSSEIALWFIVKILYLILYCLVPFTFHWKEVNIVTLIVSMLYKKIF
jgi:hypothetical protein